MFARILLWWVGCVGVAVGLFGLAALLTPTLIEFAASKMTLMISSENEVWTTRMVAGLVAALPALFAFLAALVDAVRWRQAPPSRRVWTVLGVCVTTLVARTAWETAQYRFASRGLGDLLPMLSVRETSPIAHALGALLVCGAASLLACVVTKPRSR